jgi:hypothetical protein
MTKRIQSYQDLVDEKERLQSLLQMQKELVHQDIRDIGESLAPVRSVISLAGKLVTRDSSNLLLNAGTNTLIDLVVKKLLLSKAGWLMRLAVPFLLKNFSSHFVAEKKGALINKLFSWIGKKNAKRQQEEAYED